VGRKKLKDKDDNTFQQVPYYWRCQIFILYHNENNFSYCECKFYRHLY